MLSIPDVEEDCRPLNVPVQPQNMLGMNAKVELCVEHNLPNLTP
jgi:hypothetical protein